MTLVDEFVAIREECTKAINNNTQTLESFEKRLENIEKGIAKLLEMQYYIEHPLIYIKKDINMDGIENFIKSQQEGDTNGS